MASERLQGHRAAENAAGDLSSGVLSLYAVVVNRIEAFRGRNQTNQLCRATMEGMNGGPRCRSSPMLLTKDHV